MLSWLKRPSTWWVTLFSILIAIASIVMKVLHVSDFWQFLVLGTMNFNLGAWYMKRLLREDEEARILREARELEEEEERLLTEPPPPTTCGVLCKVIPFRRRMKP